LNLAAFGIGMNNQEPIPSEVTTNGGSTGQHTGISERSALGTSPLGG
jgi:hypothetical protein